MCGAGAQFDVTLPTADLVNRVNVLGSSLSDSWIDGICRWTNSGTNLEQCFISSLFAAVKGLKVRPLPELP